LLHFLPIYLIGKDWKEFGRPVLQDFIESSLNLSLNFGIGHFKQGQNAKIESLFKAKFKNQEKNRGSSHCLLVEPYKNVKIVK